MEVEEHNHALPSNQNDSRWFKVIEGEAVQAGDPVGWLFFELINQGAVNSLYAVDQYIAKYPSLKLVFEKTIDECTKKGLIKIENGRIVPLKECIYFDFKFDLDSAFSFIPDLAHRAFEKVVHDYAVGTADTKHDFAEYFCFPDNPKVKAEITQALNNCRKELYRIQLNSEKLAENANGIRLVNLSHGTLSIEDCI